MAVDSSTVEDPAGGFAPTLLAWGIVKSDDFEIARFVQFKSEIRNLKSKPAPLQRDPALVSRTSNS